MPFDFEGYKKAMMEFKRLNTAMHASAQKYTAVQWKKPRHDCPDSLEEMCKLMADWFEAMYAWCDKIEQWYQVEMSATPGEPGPGDGTTPPPPPFFK